MKDHTVDPSAKTADHWAPRRQTLPLGPTSNYVQSDDFTSPNLHMLYVHGYNRGYARYGTKLAEAVRNAGVVVDDALDPECRPRHLVVWVATPAHAGGWFEGQHPVISTMWEAKALPESFREGLHNFAQVIVPCEANLELLSNYHDNVVKVPLGVDGADWVYRPRQAPSREFRFLIGGSGDRKGQDLAYKAFRKVFATWPKDMPVPVLIFKEPRSSQYLGERIEHVTGAIPGGAEVELYANAHCYLGPSRGEGFGLQPLQAIAQGLPTILTNAHGQAEYAHLGFGISAGTSKSSYFVFGDAGDWWEPNFDELCERMEWVYYNYADACKDVKVNSDLAHRDFTWDRVAENMINAIGPEHFTEPYKGSGKWVVPEIRRYLVRVNVFWACEIAGRHFQFWPTENMYRKQLDMPLLDVDVPKDYYEVADVKRILYEAQVLDASCVTSVDMEDLAGVHSGLTKQQLEVMGEYSASQSYCHHCHQKLGTGDKYEPNLTLIA